MGAVVQGVIDDGGGRVHENNENGEDLYDGEIWIHTGVYDCYCTVQVCADAVYDNCVRFVKGTIPESGTVPDCPPASLVEGTSSLRLHLVLLPHMVEVDAVRIFLHCRIASSAHLDQGACSAAQMQRGMEQQETPQSQEHGIAGDGLTPQKLQVTESKSATPYKLFGKLNEFTPGKPVNIANFVEEVRFELIPPEFSVFLEDQTRFFGFGTWIAPVEAGIHTSPFGRGE